MSQLAEDIRFDPATGLPQPVSQLLPYAGLVLSIALVTIFFVRYYLFEPLIKRYYKNRYWRLNEKKRRGLVNHYVAGITKMVLVGVTAYPFFALMVGRSLQWPVIPGSRATLGDIVVAGTHVVTAMYAHELCYRESISWLGVAHHVGAMIIAQSALVLSFDPVHTQDAGIELKLLILWGFFDIAAEFWPHVAIIVHRTWPDHHHAKIRVFSIISVFMMYVTTVETVTVMCVFGQLWTHWSLEFKIATPILHVLFTGAQLWGAKVLWAMFRGEQEEQEKLNTRNVEQVV